MARIVWGTRLFGRVENVPGLFYVATSFQHFCYVPLIPVQSWVVLAGTENSKGWRGIPIARNANSVMMAWIRAGLLIGAFWAVANSLSDGGEPAPDLGLKAAIAVGGVLFYVLSRIFTRPSFDRAVELANQAGIGEAVMRDLHRIYKRPPPRIAPPPRPRASAPPAQPPAPARAGNVTAPRR